MQPVLSKIKESPLDHEYLYKPFFISLSDSHPWFSSTEIQNPSKNKKNLPKYSYSHSFQTIPDSQSVQRDVLKIYQETRMIEDSLTDEDCVMDSAFDFHSDLTLSVDGASDSIGIDSNSSIPVMISLKAGDSQHSFDKMMRTRSPIDLVCVLDTSGSMEGEKIQLVQKTLKNLLSLLSPKDRVALIAFNNTSQCLTSFKRVSDSNKELFSDIIDGIESHGGTNIAGGVYEAMILLRKRKFRNPVTSVFLLTDGIDPDDNALKYVKNSMKILKRTSDFFTMNCFGFGVAHDSELLSSLARESHGNFYFVKDLSRVNEFFMDAIGLLFSIVLKNIKIQIVSNLENLDFQPKILKTYGNMWEINPKTNELSINMEFFSRGMTKNFIFEASFPTSNMNIQKRRRAFEVKMTALTLKGNQIRKKRCFELDFRFDSQYKNSTLNEEVWANYLRVFAAEKLEIARRNSDLLDFRFAQKELNDALTLIQNCHIKECDFLGSLQKDLEDALFFCQVENYNNEKKALVTAFFQNHMFQQSTPGSNLNEQNIYSTNFQTYLSFKSTAASTNSLILFE